LFAQPDPIQQIKNALDEIGLLASLSSERLELSTLMPSRIVQQPKPTAKKGVGSMERAEWGCQQYFPLALFSVLLASAFYGNQ
jgi:hypothetical protein